MDEVPKEVLTTLEASAEDTDVGAVETSSEEDPIPVDEGNDADGATAADAVVTEEGTNANKSNEGTPDESTEPDKKTT